MLHAACGKCRAQIIATCAPLHNFVVYIFATKACIDNQRNLLNSNISSTCSHNMANFGRLMAEIGWWVWGTPANSTGFSVLALLLQRRCSPEANQTLHDVWPSPGLIHYVYIFWGLLPGANFTASKSWVLLSWQHYCMALDHWASAKL